MDSINNNLNSVQEFNDAEVLRQVPLMAFLTILGISGIIGNSLVCYIYKTEYKTSNCRTFLIVLSSIDLFKSGAIIPFKVWTLFWEYNFTNVWICKLSIFLYIWPTMTSGFLLFAIAVDRYRKVCKHYSWQISHIATRNMCISAFLLGVAFSWMLPVIHGITTAKHSVYNITISQCEVTESMVATPFYLINNILFAILFIGTLSGIIVMYCFIAVRVKQQTERKVLLCGAHGTAATNLGAFKNGPDKTVPQTNNKNGNNENGLTKLTSVDKSKHLTNITEHDINKHIDADIDENTTGSLPNLSYDTGLRTNDITKVGIENKSGSMPDMLSETRRGIYDTTREGDEQTKTGSMPDLSSETRIGTSNDRTESIDKERMTGSVPILSCETRLGTTDKTGAGIANKKTGSMPDLSSRRKYLTVSEALPPTRYTANVDKKLQQKENHRVALIMFLISLTFILTYLPVLCLLLIRNADKTFLPSLSLAERTMYNFFLRTYYIHCAVNPVIYGVWDYRFRKACQHALCKRKRQRI